MATYKPYKKTESGKEEIKIPYSVLSNPPDLSAYAKLAGGNTFSGNQVITGYLDIRGTAAEKHLKTRGIGGSDGNGNSSDLYLQYSSDYKTYFGKTAQSSLNADGSISINGKTAATIDQIPDVSGKANLSGGNTFTGKQTLNSPPADGYSINASGYVKGSWLQAPSTGKAGSNTGKVCVLDGSGWIYYRTPEEVLSDAGGAKASDVPTFSLSGTTLYITL